MPTYEYACAGCGATTEVRASLAEKQSGLDPRCERCGAGDLRRMFSTLTVIGAGAPAAEAAAGGCCGGACGC